MPLNYGTRVIGAIVISKLGLDQFDEDDLRLLEVLAGHAAVALENARLYEAQRREAESAQGAARVRARARGRRGPRPGARASSSRAPRSSLGAPHASLWLQEPARRRPRRPRRRRLRGRRTSRRPPLPGRRRRAVRRRGSSPYFVGPDEYAAFASPRRAARRVRVAPFARRRTLGRDRRRGTRRGRASATASSSCSAGSRTRRSSRSRTRRSFECARAHVPLHGRGARERARGERRVHVLARALDHRHRAARRRGARSRRRALKRLELGALFHDIGKIGIPNSILLKPGAADRGGARADRDAPRARRADPRADRPAARRLRDRPRLPRALGRRGLSGPQGRRGDPARGADHLRLRRVPRDDDRPAVPPALARDEALRRLERGGRDAVRPDRRRGLPARARSHAPRTEPRSERRD